MPKHKPLKTQNSLKVKQQHGHTAQHVTHILTNKISLLVMQSMSCQHQLHHSCTAVQVPGPAAGGVTGAAAAGRGGVGEVSPVTEGRGAFKEGETATGVKGVGEVLPAGRDRTGGDAGAGAAVGVVLGLRGGLTRGVAARVGLGAVAAVGDGV